MLPASFALDADRVARFTREAKTLAALNHPNIAAIYGLEKTPDFTALVMELVEGEDLSSGITGAERNGSVDRCVAIPAIGDGPRVAAMHAERGTSGSGHWLSDGSDSIPTVSSEV